MKNFLYSAFMLAVVILTACSNDDNGETQPKRGMTLNASVENLSSRATMTDENGTWKFAFTKGDKVSVSNNKISTYYTFTNGGEQFACADAVATTEAANWYAYFPGNEVDLTNQSGTLANVANWFAVAGETTEATTGENNLSITLQPKVAVLRIVAVDKKGVIDIHVKTADGKWVKGLTATKNADGFTVVSTSDTKPTLLHKGAGEVAAGEITYVVVPAGVKIAIYNGDLLLNTTQDTGLKAGKYYTITSGPTKGKAKVKDTETEIEWVQLWAGGPRFATENVDKEMTWTEAAETGSDYVWGENWRTPTAEEVEDLNGGGLQYDWENSKAKEGSPTFTINTSADGTEETVEFTGVQPGYTKNKLTLYKKVVNGYNQYDFWTSSQDGGYGCKFIIWRQDNFTWNFGISKRHDPNTDYCLVRPVLSIPNITNNTNNNK